MLNNISVLSSLSLALNILLGVSLLLKFRQITHQKLMVDYFKSSLEEIDEQAKLIVRTDLELNKTQDELDKRINSLYALQRLTREFSKTLDRDEIFTRINPDDFYEMGFQKAAFFLKNQAGNMLLKYHAGYAEKELQMLEPASQIIESVMSILEKSPAGLSSLSSDAQMKQIIKNTFGYDSFIIAPIIKEKETRGFIYLGNDPLRTALTAGDEELVSILSTDLSQALYNAELFEAAYSQHQLLEKKVKERTQELNDTMAELKAASKRKSDFVSSVSHELRTPLTSIKGYASILISEKLGVLPEEVKKRLSKINIHSNELTQMVNDLLDIARIESGKTEMHFEPLNIRLTVESVCDMLGALLKEKNINLQINLPQDMSSIIADKTQLSRVFINILGNAIKFVPLDKGEIKISGFESNEFVQISIADNGLGMSETDCAHIFEEFYRVDNAVNQKVKGTGLGLTLVKNIILSHKGNIWVESQINHGTIFSFTLPKARA